MGTYFIFGRYTKESLARVSSDRTKEAVDVIKSFGGIVKSMHAILGKQDLLFQVELPGIQEAIKASLTLSKVTGINFSTAEAVPVEEFDKIASNV